MRLAISNIAWDTAEDLAIAELLREHGVDAIDVAPSKYLAEPASPHARTLEAVRAFWAARGIEITGMQSLLFGTTGLNVFGDADVQERMLVHLGRQCEVGRELGAPRLVFGSPRNRDCSNVPPHDVIPRAVQFFRRLGDVAARAGVWVCLEPNPPAYGANFMTNSADTEAVVRATAHPAIRMQLDVGAMAMNEEPFAPTVGRCAELYGHVHASEPGLVPLGDGAADHGAAAAAIARYMPGAVVSIEMVATANEPHVAAIRRALSVALRSYGKGLEEAS